LRSTQIINSSATAAPNASASVGVATPKPVDHNDGKS
jgi:hypothetical protein